MNHSSKDDFPLDELELEDVPNSRNEIPDHGVGEMANEDVEDTSIIQDDDCSEDQKELDIDAELDDAMDEGYMGMECTLERGFSLNESVIQRDIRSGEYKELSMNYEILGFRNRYSNALRQLIPVRKKFSDRNEMPVDNAGFFSFLMFSWMTPFIWKAYKKGLKDEDIPLCSKYDMCGYNTQRLLHYWREELKNKGDSASLKWPIWKFIRTRIFIALLVIVITLILGFAGPAIFMRKLIMWLSTEEPISTGLLLVLGLVLCEFGRCITFALVWAINYRTAIRLRTACLGLIYGKLMRVSSLGNKSMGEIINLFANDSQRIYDFICHGPYIIGGPIMAVMGFGYILWLLGPWALLGMASFLVFYSLQICISRLMGYFRRKTIIITDERVSMMNEIISCVKMIKMYAWEKSFIETIRDIRNQEMKMLQKGAYIQSISLSLPPTVPVLAAIFTFMSHIWAGNNLTPAQGLSIVSLFLVNIRISFEMVFYSILAIVEFFETMKRIQSVLMMPEMEHYVQKLSSDEAVGLKVNEADFTWICRENDKPKLEEIDNVNGAVSEGLLQHPQKDSFMLKDISFTIKKGQILGICGSIGAGKSSLLLGILGHMNLRKGSVSMQDSVAFVGQEAWILNDTLRENILFGEPFDAKSYFRVVYACSLTKDIELLPGGDNTEIGERGVNLSGGQKQRLSLARAIYSNKSVYLLDDCLSAVDASVANHIFKYAIQTALREKSVLLVTHQMQFLPLCSSVIHLVNGKISEFGSHEELMKNQSNYHTLYKNHVESTGKRDNIENQDLVMDAYFAKSHKKDIYVENDTEMPSLSKKLKDLEKNREILDLKKQGNKTIRLTTDENLETGDIPYYVYNAYIRYMGGYFVAFLVMFCFVLNIGSTAFSSWWLSYWLNEGSGDRLDETQRNKSTINETIAESNNLIDNPNYNMYQLVYGLSALLILLTSLLRGFAFMKSSLKASSALHGSAFSKVLSSPMAFFDSTPAGRILNVFSRDMDEVDVRLPTLLEVFIQNVWMIITTFIFIILIFPYFVIFFFVLLIAFYMMRGTFKIGIREFKRRENVSRSPLFSHIGATISGLASIQAYQKEELFIERFNERLDDNSALLYLFNCSMRWLALHLDLFIMSVTVITAIFSLFLRGIVAPAFAGLALAYAAQLGGIFQHTVRLSAETEARFTSVQRLVAYIKSLTSEGDSVVELKQLDPMWPKHGRIVFSHVRLRYRPETPIVLDNVCLKINSREKIGIVGRTGSGKSSLCVALFRLVELEGGSISIDGVNISTMKLEELRSKLSIIPQDPTLFSGTVRYNLDPFECYSDDELWSSLEKSHLKTFVSSLPDKLMHKVFERGENFSVGERQLLCMARAILRNSRILFLDEATSSIDSETDAKIQLTLSEAFSECTTITVAHRLNTVMSCSRIIVMEEGHVKEVGSPDELSKNCDSLFYLLLEASQRQQSKS